MIAILKQPSEIKKLPLEFGGVSTISALGSVTVTPRGLVPGAAELIAVPTLFAGALTLTLSGGSDGERYLVSAVVDDAGGARAEEEVEVVVLNLTWTMPDGGASMLTAEEFVMRFGFDEVVRMTDARGDGRIGKDLLVSALIDAQALVESFIAGRYALPLDPVPVMVKMLIADIARGRLYPNGAPDGIADQVKVAMRTLERIAAGTSTLGTVLPNAPVSNEGSPAWVGGKRQYPDDLKDY